MKPGPLALAALVLVLVVLAKELKPTEEMPGVSSPPPRAAKEPQSRMLAVKALVARKGIGSVMATVLDSHGEKLSSVSLPEGVGRLEIPPAAAALRLEAPGHRALTLTVPPGATLEAHLELEGRDADVLTVAPPRPDTKGPVFCALRFSDDASGELIPSVRILLDGEEAGASSSNGEISVPFAKLRAARHFTAVKEGYEGLDFGLNEAVVDELHVQPLLMKRRVR